MATTVITVWDTITSTIAHAVDGVLTVLQHLIWAMQAFADGVNGVVRGVGSMASGALSAAGQWITGRSAAPQLAYARAVPVPALASGAVIPPNRAFLALLGDPAQRHQRGGAPGHHPAGGGRGDDGCPGRPDGGL